MSASEEFGDSVDGEITDGGAMECELEQQASEGELEAAEEFYDRGEAGGALEEEEALEEEGESCPEDAAAEGAEHNGSRAAGSNTAGSAASPRRGAEVDDNVDDEMIDELLEEKLAEHWAGRDAAAVPPLDRALARPPSGHTPPHDDPAHPADPTDSADPTDPADPSQPFSYRYKRIIKDAPRSSSLTLPDGWIEAIHNCGIPVYYHKTTGVVTLSRPYYIFDETLRGHELRTYGIPCLSYRLHKERGGQENAGGRGEGESMGGVEGGGERQEEGGEACGEAEGRDEAGGEGGEGGEGHGDGDGAAPAGKSPKRAKKAAGAHVEREQELSMDQISAYLSRLFEFELRRVRQFPSVRDRHAWLKERHRKQPDKNLIHVTFRCANGTEKKMSFNPATKSASSLLNDYARLTLEAMPEWDYRCEDNPAKPFSCTLLIGKMRYGTGYGTSKKAARQQAIESSLRILMPDAADKMLAADAKLDQKIDLKMFDEMPICDSRVPQMCILTNKPSPYTLLCECVKRNFGFGDTSLSCSLKTLSHLACEYTLSVGPHSVTVQAKNKRDGRQKASQELLQKLHPNLDNWGAILALYETSLHDNEQTIKSNQRSLTELCRYSKKGPNASVIAKLKEEMLKIYEQRGLRPVRTVLEQPGLRGCTAPVLQSAAQAAAAPLPGRAPSAYSR